MNLSEWKERNKKAKKYAHFDTRNTLDNVWSYISNPIKVEKHSFYPFIHYEKKFNKFKDGKVIPKCRELCYSAHIDRYIFSYYGYLLNEKYNQILADKGIEEVAIAYRNNLFKNNIHFAKKAFDTIRKLEKCYIMIGDFTSFFDQLDHMYLKERLCEVLEVEKLPPDYYTVYKNITKYAKVELEHLLMINNLPINDRGIEELKSKRQVLTLTEFRKAKRTNPKFITKNQKGYGIPQGSAISAVLSNIYMIKYDEQINQLVTKRGGTYLRYSDDFIIILPGTQEDFYEVYEEIECIRKSVPRLDLQKEKTQIFIYNEKELKNINSLICEGVPNGKNLISYLGFTFDGTEITIREKTVTKYYYRMYRKLKTIVKNGGYTPDGKRISCNNVYKKYSIKGAKQKPGNFISYVERAQNIFGPEEPIDRKTKRHMLKIRRKLDQI